MTLSAGWANADITPSAGIHMGGYWGRRSGATGVHDALEVRVLVVGEIAVVTLDLVGLAPATVARVRAAVAGAVGAAEGGSPLREDAVLVACTHTHAGPLTLPFRGMGDVDAAYLERVVHAAAAAATEAAVVRQPVRLRYARPPVQIGINRRQGRPGAVTIGENPEGPVDGTAHVVVVEGVAGRAVLFQHACHPVVLGNANHEISAEFPGPARAEVEAGTGAFAIFVNGACGDINPRRHGGGFADVDALGRELGAAVAAAVDTAEPVDASATASTAEHLALPLMAPPTTLQAAAERSLLELKAAIRAAGADEWAARVPLARRDWARQLLAVARDKERATTQAFEVQGLRLGGVRLLGMEGEMFVRYQLDLPQAAGAPTVLCGYANGCIGYVPTADEYPRGGYEVDEAYKVYPSVLMIAPESEALIRAAAARVLAAL